MRMTLIEAMKSEIEKRLRNFLREEGIELYIAANDNATTTKAPSIELESVADFPLEGSALLSEIKLSWAFKANRCSAKRL